MGRFSSRVAALGCGSGVLFGVVRRASARFSVQTHAGRSALIVARLLWILVAASGKMLVIGLQVSQGLRHRRVSAGNRSSLNSAWNASPPIGPICCPPGSATYQHKLAAWSRLACGVAGCCERSIPCAPLSAALAVCNRAGADTGTVARAPHFGQVTCFPRKDGPASKP